MSTVFDEINATKRLIQDTREVLYSLQETHKQYGETSPGGKDLMTLIRDKQIIIKGLEMYQTMLEATVNARSRSSSRITMETVISN